jgi:hypothetical protein
MRFPEIDYDTHPAYAPFKSPVNYDDSFIEEQVREIDAASGAFYALAKPTEAGSAEALARIRASMDRILHHVKERRISVVAEEWLRQCARWTVADFSYEFMRRIFCAREYRPVRLGERQTDQLHALQTRGMYVTELEPNLYAEIKRAAMEQFETLKARSLAKPHERAVSSVSYHSPLWKAIIGAVRKAGILEVLGEFKRNGMTMLGAGLEYSHAGQRWYQNLYSDVALPGGPLQYLHYDEGDCLPKSMIYLTPVREEGGPTRAIPSSNCWEVSECKIRVHRALDRIIGDRYADTSEEGDYRVLARRPELRRIFMELPPALRGSSHFGDDILADTELASTLKSLEVPYLSDGGQTMVFDGPRLLHRGSLVGSGERLSLQVIYRNRNEARIRSALAKQTLLREQAALWRKYARRFVMEHA